MKDRIKRHSSGYIEATKKRLPIKLSTYFAFQEEHAAFNFEKYLKSGSERAFARRHGFIE